VAAVGEHHLLVVKAPELTGLIDVDPAAVPQADHEATKRRQVFIPDQPLPHTALSPSGWPNESPQFIHLCFSRSDNVLFDRRDHFFLILVRVGVFDDGPLKPYRVQHAVFMPRLLYDQMHGNRRKGWDNGLKLLKDAYR
jgi:hypothetical protein